MAVIAVKLGNIFQTFLYANMSNSKRVLLFLPLYFLLFPLLFRLCNF